MCSGRRRTSRDRHDRCDRRDHRAERLASARIILSTLLRSRTRIGTRLSLASRRVPHACLYRPIRTAEVLNSRFARLLASFGSLTASPTLVVAPSSLESRNDPDVADPNQNVSRPKAPLPGSSSHAAGFGARIMPWREAQVAWRLVNKYSDRLDRAPPRPPILLKGEIPCRRDPVACTRTLLVGHSHVSHIIRNQRRGPKFVRLTVRSECPLTLEVFSCANVVRARSLFVREVRAPAKFVRTARGVSLVCLARESERLCAGQLGRAVTLGPTDSDIFDLQHKDAPWEG